MASKKMIPVSDKCHEMVSKYCEENGHTMTWFAEKAVMNEIERRTKENKKESN